MTDLPERDPRLVWTDAGEPRSARYGDVYFSAEDGLAETRTVFLEGCGLPQAWADRPVFTVAELGFGSGLNLVALLDLWRRHRPRGGRLHVFTVEAHPLDADQARRALSAWPEIAETSAALLARWPAPTPGFHRIDLAGIDAVVDVAIGDVAWALSRWSGRADAWFLDGFAPSVNPAMWSDAVLDLIAARSGPGTRVATFTVAGAVRRGLAQRGFVVDKRPGHGRKRERLEARLPGTAPPLPSPGPVIVIGAGIAGASVCRALAAAGADPILIEAAGPGAGASGFPAGLVTPRFDLGDDDVAALFAQALTRAEALYSPIPGAVIARGVTQLPTMERDARRFERIARQPIWAEGAMTLNLSPLDAGDPDAPAGPALSMACAFVAAPAEILSAWLPAGRAIPGHAARLEPSDTGWRVLGADGTCLAEAARVVLCAGAGNADLLPELALAPVRGQADWVQGETAPARAWGGYVAPTADGFLFGATHDRGDTDTDVRPEDTARNLAALAARLPRLAERVRPLTIHSHAAVRATTRDRLPVAGAVPGRPGLFVLGGLGSRGLCLAPLLGEHLAALTLQRPSPLPAAIAERITPARAPVSTLARRPEAEDV